MTARIPNLCNRGMEKTTQRAPSWSVFLTEYSRDEIKNEMGGTCGRNGRHGRCIQGLDWGLGGGLNEGKRLLGRPRHRCGCGRHDWIAVTHDRNAWLLWLRWWFFGVSWNAGNFFTSRGSVSFSGRALVHGVNFYFLVSFDCPHHTHTHTHARARVHFSLYAKNEYEYLNTS